MFSIDLEVGMRDQSKLLEEIRVFGFSNDIKLIRARISKERTGDILNVECCDITLPTPAYSEAVRISRYNILLYYIKYTLTLQCLHAKGPAKLNHWQ